MKGKGGLRVKKGRRFGLFVLNRKPRLSNEVRDKRETCRICPELALKPFWNLHREKKGRIWGGKLSKPSACRNEDQEGEEEELY